MKSIKDADGLFAQVLQRISSSASAIVIRLAVGARREQTFAAPLLSSTAHGSSIRAMDRLSRSTDSIGALKSTRPHLWYVRVLMMVPDCTEFGS